MEKVPEYMFYTMAMRYRFNEGSIWWPKELGYDPLWR